MLEEVILNSAASGVFISLAAYGIGVLVKRRWNTALANPLMIAILLVILFLLATGTDYETYNASAKYLSYLLAPATVSLAIPMYDRLHLLKENYRAILTGILSGVEPFDRIGAGAFIWPDPGRVCDASAEICHHGDRYGRGGRTGRTQ